MKRRFWQPHEDEIIRKEYANTHAGEVAKKLKRSASSVWARANLLNIKKDREWLRENSRQNMQKPNHGGHKTQFKKGIIPHNKGEKMSPELYKKLEATMFKIGHSPHNTRKDFDISVRKDKSGRSYKYIRTKLGVWEPYHRYIWERENGKIPEGKILVFKDKNTLNIKIENLELISRKENMERNTIHRYPEDIVRTTRLIGVLNRYINKKLEKNEQK